MSERIRVVLCDDHALVRAGVRRVLESVARVDLVAEIGTAAEALAALATHQPDVLILDLHLPDADGFHVLQRAPGISSRTRVLVLSLHGEAALVRRALREGAAGYLVKDMAVQELPRAVEVVASGGVYLGERAQEAITESVRGVSERPIDRLTPRERDVLIDVARGLPTKAIAADRGISPRTVETHRASLMRKLDLHSVAELTRFAIENGMLVPRRGPSG